MTNYGEESSANYIVRIQQCGSWPTIASDILSIVQKCDEEYPGEVYFIVSKDAEATGNLEMSIELKDDESSQMWVH